MNPIPRADRFRFIDLLAESTADIGSRPGRLVLTLAGTVLGIGALVVTWGLAATAADQIARTFDAVAATQVVVTPATANGPGGKPLATAALPADAADRVMLLAGVTAAATLSPVDLADGTVTAVSVADPSAPASVPPKVFAASAGLLDTIGGRVVTGRAFDGGHDRRGDRVAMLGQRAADALAIGPLDTQPSVFVDGRAYAVVGIFTDVDLAGELLGAVVIPDGAARADFGLGSPASVRARISVGAGPQLRAQIPRALAPDSPGSITIGAPPARSTLNAGVQGDVGVIFGVLGLVVLLAGGLGIANVTMLSVAERTGEIGLRRALGATRGQIAGQFVVESVVVGLLGGLIGAGVGVCTVVAVAAVQQWTPVLDPLVAVGATALGALVGLIAGGLPARRAAGIEPVDALRGA